MVLDDVMIDGTVFKRQHSEMVWRLTCAVQCHGTRCSDDDYHPRQCIHPNMYNVTAILNTENAKLSKPTNSATQSVFITYQGIFL